MDNIKTIKPEVQKHGRYIAVLNSRTAHKTISALRADDYGVEFVAKLSNGGQAWMVSGEPSLRERLCIPMTVGEASVAASNVI
jgi:hypothetical protein